MMNKTTQQKIYVSYILFLLALAFYLVWIHLGDHTGDKFQPNVIKNLYDNKKGLY